MVYFIVKNLIRFPHRKRIKPRCLIVLRSRSHRYTQLWFSKCVLILKTKKFKSHNGYCSSSLSLSDFYLKNIFIVWTFFFDVGYACGRIGKLIFGRFTTNLTSKQLLSVFMSVSVCLSVSLSVGLFVCFNLTNANSNQKEMELLPVNVPSAASNRRS